jgi:hypothetical protein
VLLNLRRARLHFGRPERTGSIIGVTVITGQIAVSQAHKQLSAANKNPLALERRKNFFKV